MPTSKELIERRARQRGRLRRRRIIAALVVVALVAVACVWGALALGHVGQQRAPQPVAAASVTHSASPSATSSTRPSASPKASPTRTLSPSATPTPSASATYVAGGPVPRPAITKDYINFDARRRAEMAAYALTHYGSSTILLEPKVIVLHYTAGSTYASAHATFESDAPNMGVKPGVVSQFVIDKNGTIYEQIPLTYMGRHTVGLNYVALGIECVQEGLPSDAQTVGQIMHRPAQEQALVGLVRWLMYRYHISLSNVIGHGMANDSPYFKDLKGWKNDHTDWSKSQIELLRAKLK